MKASLQERIAPTISNSTQTFSDSAVREAGQAMDSTALATDKADFRDLLMNSNADIRQQREITGKDDLAGAKSEKEFLEKLADKTNPEKLRAPKNTMDKDDFLKLFVTQLQHQDPLSPKDSSEMAAQLANFNGLEQMMNINKNLESMSKQENSGRALGLVNYIGKEISIKSGRLKLEAGKEAKGNFTIDKPITEATLQVRDASGVVVSEKSLGAFEAGDQEFVWEGKSKKGQDLNEGIYSFNINAKNSDGTPVNVDVTSKVKVIGIDLKNDKGGFFTDMGPVKPDDIAAVGDPGFARKSLKAVKVAKDKDKPKDVVNAANGASDELKAQTKENKGRGDVAPPTKPVEAKKDGTVMEVKDQKTGPAEGQKSVEAPIAEQKAVEAKTITPSDTKVQNPEVKPVEVEVKPAAPVSDVKAPEATMASAQAAPVPQGI